MKRILLPTDFSDNAYNAISYAVKLMLHEVCEFFILHTYTPPMVSAGSMYDSYSALSMQKVAEEETKKKLQKLEKKLSKEFSIKHHSFTCIASFNLLITEMKELIDEKEIDFVVMGTQGATGAKEIFLGTQTMYAIKKMKVPVLAVPSAFNYEEPKEILFPTDYRIERDNRFLELIRDLCERHTSRLNILNAYYGTPLTKKQIENKEFLDIYFKKNAHIFHIAEGTDVIGAVTQFQLKANINLLVMIHNKHNFLENILFKPVINQIVYHINVPFLVIPSVKRQ